MPEPVNPNAPLKFTIDDWVVGDLGWAYEVSDDGERYIFTCPAGMPRGTVPVRGPAARQELESMLSIHAREHIANNIR